MNNPPRRVPVPNPHQYYAVPQTPASPPRTSRTRSTTSRATRYDTRYPSRAPSATTSQAAVPQRPYMHRDVTRGIATGVIGNGYGPYSYEQVGAAEYAAYHQSTNQYPTSATDPTPKPVNRRQSSVIAAPVNTSTVPAFMWDTKDPDLDDPLHNPDPIRDAALDHAWTIWSSRGWANAIMLVIICVGLITLFAGYPIIHYVIENSHKKVTGNGIGGINATGQIPSLLGMPTLIDPATPDLFRTRTGTDGKHYLLVFSDEFEVDGRSFYPGDDPYWEAADLHYWPTADIEWYDPSAITTENGKMVITMTETRNHDLDFMGGMITTWNKMCFTTGYIEVSVSMPGTPTAPGLWPAAWTMGNLGRAGYGATTEGLWPYTYDACDLGTFPFQMKDNQPSAAVNGGIGGGQLSELPGQRLSACTCPNSDHPGPRPSVGRGAPEIDIFETQVNTSLFRGQVSQSAQFAPYNYQYEMTNNRTPEVTLYDTTNTLLNSYKGGVYQQAASALTFIDSQNYNDSHYASYGFEWWSNPGDRDEGYITWFSEGQKSWTMTTASMGPDPATGVSQRIISEEPHYLVLNLGMSPGFQAQDYAHLQFPVKMYIDYVRIYQREDVNEDAFGCDPKSHPTAKYINEHMTAYTNPNLTTWAQANQTFPRNSLYNGCY